MNQLKIVLIVFATLLYLFAIVNGNSNKTSSDSKSANVGKSGKNESMSITEHQRDNDDPNGQDLHNSSVTPDIENKQHKTTGTKVNGNTNKPSSDSKSANVGKSGKNESISITEHQSDNDKYNDSFGGLQDSLTSKEFDTLKEVMAVTVSDEA